MLSPIERLHLTVSMIEARSIARMQRQRACVPGHKLPSHRLAIRIAWRIRKMLRSA